jgi:hypothetical protein
MIPLVALEKMSQARHKGGRPKPQQVPTERQSFLTPMRIVVVSIERQEVPLTAISTLSSDTQLRNQRLQSTAQGPQIVISLHSRFFARGIPGKQPVF